MDSTTIITTISSTAFLWMALIFISVPIKKLHQLKSFFPKMFSVFLFPFKEIGTYISFKRNNRIEGLNKIIQTQNYEINVIEREKVQLWKKLDQAESDLKMKQRY